MKYTIDMTLESGNNNRSNIIFVFLTVNQIKIFFACINFHSINNQI